MSTETEVPRDVRQLKTGRDWHGYLTLENYAAVGERLRALLTGKRYTFVAVNSGSDYRPEVRTGLELRDNGLTVHDPEDDGQFASINVSDTYGVWGIHVFDVPTSQQDGYECRNAAWDKASDEDKRGWQWQDKRLTYLHFKWDRIEIEHFAMAGHRIVWVAVVEPDAEVPE